MSAAGSRARRQRPGQDYTPDDAAPHPRRAHPAGSRDPQGRRPHLHPVRRAGELAHRHPPRRGTASRRPPSATSWPTSRTAGCSSSRTPPPAASPAAAGYHFYIDSLMEARGLSAEERRRIENGYKLPSVRRRRRCIDTTAQLLSELWRRSAIIVTPAIGDSRASRRSTSCRCRAATRALRRGARQRRLRREQADRVARGAVRASELVRITNYLTENFRGARLREIRERLLGLDATRSAARSTACCARAHLRSRSVGFESGRAGPSCGSRARALAVAPARARPTSTACAGCSTPSPSGSAWSRCSTSAWTATACG